MSAATKEKPTAQDADAIAFDPHADREAQLKKAYPGEQFEQLLSLDEAMLKAEWEAYNHKVKLLAPVYKQRSEFIRKIPGFWLKVFTQDPHLSNFVSPADRDALAHLEDLVVEHDPEDARNVTFHFHFAKENPYFSDRILTKKYSVNGEEEDTATTNGTKTKAHPKLVEMNKKYELEQRTCSEPLTINWTSDEHNLVAKRPGISFQDVQDTDEPIEIWDAFGSFFNFFTYKDDGFEIHTAVLEVHSKALDLYAGIIEAEQYPEYSDDEDEDEEDGDPNQVVDLESEPNDEPKKKKAKVVP